MTNPERNSGYVCLHRSIREHWIYKDARKLKWWLEILMECNHSDQKVSIGFELINCNRGQSLNSLPTWSKLFGVDVSTTRRFFVLLERDKMIVTENVQKTTRLTVCNYDSYNGQRQAKDTQSNLKAISRGSQGNSDAIQTITNKNVNNDKEAIDGAFGQKERQDFLRFEEWISENAPRVAGMKEPFTIKNYLDLKKKYPVSEIMELLKEMHNYEPLLKKNRSANLTILKWFKRRENEETNRKSTRSRYADNASAFYDQSKADFEFVTGGAKDSAA